jgi:hypothetical protein
VTRLPGREFGQAYQSLSPEAQTTVLTEFKLCLSTIRGWTSPWGEERIFSLTGGAIRSIRSIRVPNHTIGPCETPQEFYDYLLAPAPNSFDSEAEYEEQLHCARKVQSLERPGVKFTHGDIKHHNILVDEEGHILVSWIGSLLVGIQGFGNTLQNCDFCQKTFGGISF